MVRHYIPILKGKQGELAALKRAFPEVRSAITPLLEVVPWEADVESADFAEQTSAEVARTVSRFSDAWTIPGARVLIDAQAAEVGENEAGQRPEVPSVIASVIRGMRENNVAAEPVVHVADPDNLLQEVAELVEPDGGAAIRITAEDLDDVVTPLRVMVDRTADRIGLRADQIDLILDFGAITDDGATALATRLARFVLPLLADGDWRHFVLAAGAFPEMLGDVPAYSIGELPRRDADMWKRLQQLQLPRPLDYGDYAVTHPTMPAGGAFAAPPQLRYTLDEHWIAIKGRRQDRRGHQQFYDICEQALAHLGESASPANSSWGDAYIDQAAKRTAAGPGNASTWRAIGTSHHLAYVVKRLNERDEP